MKDKADNVCAMMMIAAFFFLGYSVVSMILSIDPNYPAWQWMVRMAISLMCFGFAGVISAIRSLSK